MIQPQHPPRAVPMQAVNGPTQGHLASGSTIQGHVVTGIDYGKPKIEYQVGVERFTTVLDPKTPENMVRANLELLLHKELLPYVDRILREGKMEELVVQYIEQMKLVDATRGI